MGSEEQFCLRWNDFQQCIKSTFQGLREERDFMDVTISCDGEQVKAHKVILSACSDTFRNLLKKNPAQNPVIVLWDVTPRDLTSILDFMYQGEVNVKQEHLNTFLAVAEKLRVRGLCQNDSGSNSSSSNSKQFSSHSEKPKARPSDTSFSSEPSHKRPRTGAQVQESQDDDIEEVPVAPVVKQETADPTVTPGSSSRLSRTDTDYQVADPGAGAYDDQGMAEYGDEYGYEDEMEYGEGVDPGQAKERKKSVASEAGSVFPPSLLGLGSLAGVAGLAQAAQAAGLPTASLLSQLAQARAQSGQPQPGLANRGDNSGGGGPRADLMRMRTVYSSKQILELEKEFHYNHFLTGERRTELATQLGLTEDK